MFIGYRLQKLRKKRKLTQKALAEMTGISRSYLSDNEELEDERFEEIEELSENEIVEKQIINNDLNITYKTGSLSKKEILNINKEI